MWNACRNLIKLVPNTINHQQVRTTYVLKRRNEPHRTTQGFRPKRLKPRFFVYDQIDNTHNNPQEDLHLILKTYVEGYGYRGDEVKVEWQKGYERLLLPGLAEYFSEDALQRLQIPLEGETQERQQHSSPFAAKMVRLLGNMVMDVCMNKDQPWTIEAWHIRTSLRKTGIVVDSDEQIEMPSFGPITGPNMDLENKEFLVYITINNLEKAPLRCRIHHWSTKILERLPPVPGHPWRKVAEPVFPEQAELLASLPPPYQKFAKAL